MNRIIVPLLLALVSLGTCRAEQDLEFSIDDFDGVNGVFNLVTFFEFDLEFNDPVFVAGETYVDPPLNQVDYSVFGVLPEQTPSGFPSFNLIRSIGGQEFYDQGSSISFEIRSDANIDDGIQIADLVSGLILNCREVGTGRYHPPLVELLPDGTGRIQNSNNFCGINPFTMMKVDVDFGEEYIVDLTFDPTQLTIIDGFQRGDLNRDCVIDLLDVEPFIDALQDPAYDYLADLNQDGADNLLDVPLLIDLLGG